MKKKLSKAKTFFVSSLVISLFVSEAISAQPNRYPPEARERYIQECMDQPLYLPVQINQQKRQQYCECYIDYLQENMTHEEYQEVDQRIRENPQDIDSSFQKIAEQAIATCYNHVFK